MRSKLFGCIITSVLQRLNESMSQIPQPHTAQHLLAFTPAQVQAIESEAGWSSALRPTGV